MNCFFFIYKNPAITNPTPAKKVGICIIKGMANLKQQQAAFQKKIKNIFLQID